MQFSKKSIGYLRYEQVLELVCWLIILTVLIFVKFLLPNLINPRAIYYTLLAFGVFNLFWFWLLPSRYSTKKKVYGWCIITSLYIFAIEDFSGGIRSGFWVFYLVPLLAAVITLDLYTIWSLVVMNSLFILAEAIWWSRGLSFETLRWAFLKVAGLSIITLFAYYLNKEGHKLKRNLEEAYEEVRHKQMELEKMNEELRKQGEKLNKTTQELEKANLELKKLAQVKSDFVSVVSHELRTPLTSIKESISLLLDGTIGEFNSEQVKFLEIAQKNVERLSRLINDILDLSKLESGRMSLHRRRINLNELTRNVYETMHFNAQDKNITVKLELSEDIEEVWVDPDKISQVITNLLSNAIKFNSEGGKIWIRTIPVITDGKEHIVFSIRDAGPGIAKEDLPKLFTRFTQLESVLTRRPGGSGLGLAISKNIIELHGGEIWADSEPGKGTDFSFRLPVYRKDMEFNFIIDEEIERTKFHQLKLALIVFKINNFEMLKTSLSGEELKSVLDVFIQMGQATVRGPEDKIAPYKEGELIAVMAGADRNGALRIVQRIISNLEKDERFHKVGLSVSFGIAVYPDEASDKEELLRKAEEMITAEENQMKPQLSEEK